MLPRITMQCVKWFLILDSFNGSSTKEGGERGKEREMIDRWIDR